MGPNSIAWIDLGALSKVRLIALNGLEKEQRQIFAARLQEVPRVKAILSEEVPRWFQWWQKRYGAGAKPQTVRRERRTSE